MDRTAACPGEDRLAAGPLFFGSTIWTFRWNPPYEDVLRRLARAGCIGFELPIWSQETPAVIRELRAIADGEGLRLTNFFFNLPFTYEAGAATSQADVGTFARGIET